MGVTPTSSWPCVGHVVSRLPPPTSRRLRLAFASAPGQRPLTLLVTVSRRIIMQKARRQTFPCGHSPPTACRHMVSGSLSSPIRGSSHLSVALLSLLSVVREYLALRDGPRRFSRDSTWLDLLRYSSRGGSAFAYGTVTLYGSTFQKILLADHFVTLM